MIRSCIFFLLTFLSPLTLFSKSVYYAEVTYQDVVEMSRDMVRLHPSFHSINSELLQRVIERFIFQLDPMKLYFLKDEVSFWLSLSPDKLEEIKRDFSIGQFPVFSKLLDLRNHAKKRHEEAVREAKLIPLQERKKIGLIDELSWAASREELVQRMGAIDLLQEQTIARFDKGLQEKAKERIEKRKRMLCDHFSYQTEEEKEKILSTIMLKAFASALDSQTAYFTPAEAKLFMSDVQQRIFGIGVLFRDDIDGFTVVELVKGGPAEKQGKLKKNDKVVAVNGEPILGDDMLEVVDKIRGLDGTYVTLQISRETPSSNQIKRDLFDITIRRGAVVVQEERVSSKILSPSSGSLGYVRLHTFYLDEKSSSSNDVMKAIVDLKNKYHIHGLILDLRGNPGGVLQQAVDLCGLFLDTALVCSVREHETFFPFWNLQTKKVWSGPLLVLVDRTSASASEIVAQTLQDWGRAVIVGDDRTFGKGSFQMVSFAVDSSAPINPKGEFKITRGRYYTTSGKSPQLIGVHSDIEVCSPYRFMKIGEEFSHYPLSTDTIPSFFEEPQLFTPEGLNQTSEEGWFSKLAAKVFSNKKFQKKDAFLQNELLFLKKNSRNRLSQSKDYQNYVQFLQKAESREEDSSSLKTEDPEWADFQLNEAIEIVNDMCHLHQKAQVAA